MNDGAERVRQVLEHRGIASAIRRFDDAMPTAAAAAERLGCPPGAVANSLLFKVGDGTMLVLTSGAHRVDLRRIASAAGVGRKKVRRADPDTVFAVTGQRVGGVAPIGHPTPLRTIVDTDLRRHEVVWAGAGDEYSMFSTSAAELVELTGGEFLEVADASDTGPE